MEKRAEGLSKEVTTWINLRIQSLNQQQFSSSSVSDLVQFSKIKPQGVRPDCVTTNHVSSSFRLPVWNPLLINCRFKLQQRRRPRVCFKASMMPGGLQTHLLFSETMKAENEPRRTIPVSSFKMLSWEGASSKFDLMSQRALNSPDDLKEESASVQL